MTEPTKGEAKVDEELSLGAVSKSEEERVHQPVPRPGFNQEVPSALNPPE